LSSRSDSPHPAASGRRSFCSRFIAEQTDLIGVALLLSRSGQRGQHAAAAANAFARLGSTDWNAPPFASASKQRRFTSRASTRSAKSCKIGEFGPPFARACSTDSMAGLPTPLMAPSA
jgi:hypothetical protein